MEVIKVSGLNFSYNTKKVLNDISFTINRGESLGIIGPNGSGKTTLLKAITGILPIRNDEIIIKDKPLSYYNKISLARIIAVVEQSGVPHLPFTVEEVVAMGRFPWLRPFASLSSRDYDIIYEILKIFELWEKRNQSIDTLSGGEKQLVSLARAMVQEPQVLFLDEPTTFLDLGNQLLLMHYVKNWQTEKNGTGVMVLHDLNLAAHYCDRILLLNREGYLEEIGQPKDVLEENKIKKVYGLKDISSELWKRMLF